jgi:hypothetical protein
MSMTNVVICGADEAGSIERRTAEKSLPEA